MIVADSNLLAYFHIPGPQQPLAHDVLRKDPVWAAPLLWRSEFRSILLKYLRAGQLGLPDALQYMAQAEAMLLGGEHPVDSALVLAISYGSGCSAYDAEFVHLAQSFGVPLVTADKQVLRAYPQLAVSLEDFVK